MALRLQADMNGAVRNINSSRLPKGAVVPCLPLLDKSGTNHNNKKKNNCYYYYTK